MAERRTPTATLHDVARIRYTKPPQSQADPLAGYSAEAVTNATTDLHLAMRARRMTDAEKVAYIVDRAAHHQAAIDDEEADRVIYAARTPDGHVKIGSTNDLPRRMAEHGIPLSSVVATMPGGFRAERAIHRRLKPSRVAGLETYAWTDQVKTFIESMSTPSQRK